MGGAGEKAAQWTATGFLFLAAFLRYAYYPLIAVIPAGLVLAGAASRKARAIRAGIVTGLAGLVPLFGLIVFSRAHLGTAVVILGVVAGLVAAIVNYMTISEIVGKPV